MRPGLRRLDVHHDLARPQLLRHPPLDLVGDLVRAGDVEVARDRDRNRALREAIAAGRGALFDRREPIEALAEALLEAGAGKRPRSSIS